MQENLAPRRTYGRDSVEFARTLTFTDGGRFVETDTGFHIEGTETLDVNTVFTNGFYIVGSASTTRNPTHTITNAITTAAAAPNVTPANRGCRSQARRGTRAGAGSIGACGEAGAGAMVHAWARSESSR